MMGVLIPSVMALRETAMTAPLGQQGEPLPSSVTAAAGTFPRGEGFGERIVTGASYCQKTHWCGSTHGSLV